MINATVDFTVEKCYIDWLDNLATKPRSLVSPFHMFDSSQTEENSAHYSNWFAQHAKRTNRCVMGQPMPHPKGRRQKDVSKPQDGRHAHMQRGPWGRARKDVNWAQGKYVIVRTKSLDILYETLKSNLAGAA